jgi:glycosyltransferase involved in cell wall biosynthesis
MTRVLERRSVRGTGGGPEKTILFGAEQHDRERFAITVCYLRDMRDEVFGIDGRAAALDVEYVEVRERHSFDHRIWPQLVDLVRTRRIDIVHGHDYKTNLLALLLARRTGAIGMATSHGWTGHSRRERWCYYPADRQVLRRLPRVIAVSSEVRERLVRSGADPSRVTVLLNGIDPAAFRRNRERGDRIREQLGYGRDDQVIGAVGRIEPQKRFDLLLDAFAAIRRDFPHARLVIVGDGSQRTAIEAHAARLGVAGACQFLGHRLDIADLHGSFDLFVQSSEYEGTPNAVLEAMAMETPLVATDVGGTRELARPDREALIVPAHDVPALTRSIAAVLSHPVPARERAKAARRRVEEELSFAGRTRQLERIYEELMANHRRSRAGHEAPRPLGAEGA